MRVRRRVPIRASALAVAASAVLAAPAVAHHGALEALFGNQGFAPLGGGFTVVDPTTGDDALNDVIGLPNGKLFAAGRAGGFAVTQLTAAGRPDPTFSGDGLRVIGAAGGEAHAVGTAPGLPLVAAGTAPLPTQPGKVAFLRGFDAAGNNASGFGSASSIIISRGADVDTVALAMAIDPPAGSGGAQPTATPLIAVGGTSGPVGATAGRRAWVAVVTSSGAFARGGIRELPGFAGGSSDDRVTDMIFTGSDRRVLVVGTSKAATQIAFVARFDTQGALDASFGGGDGFVTGAFGCDVSRPPDLTAVALDPQGRILVAGNCGDRELTLTRLNADGSPDTSFSLGESTVVAKGVPAQALASNARDITAGLALSPGSSLRIADIVPQGAERVVLVGSSVVSGVRRATAVALRITGPTSPLGGSVTFDPVFGTRGFVIAGPPNTSQSDLAAVTTAADGNLVAAGRALGKSGQFLAVKYHAARDRARPTGSVRLLGAGRRGVLAAGPVRLRLRASEPVEAAIRVRLAGTDRVIARTDVGLSPRRTRTVSVPLTVAGRAALAGRTSARVVVTAVIEDVVGKTRTIRTTVRLGG